MEAEPGTGTGTTCWVTLSTLAFCCLRGSPPTLTMAACRASASACAGRASEGARLELAAVMSVSRLPHRH